MEVAGVDHEGRAGGRGCPGCVGECAESDSGGVGGPVTTTPSPEQESAV